MANSKEMTRGAVFPLLFSFTMPLLLGNLLQQTYSLIDAAIVGKFLGINSLAAVGASTSVIFLILGFCNGCCAGFGIPVAQKFGARDYATMRRYVAVGLQLATVMSVVIAAISGFYCRDILRGMQTPGNIFDGAYEYLFVTFIGIPCTFFYNLLASIMRALGDSKTPFWFLLFSTVLNVFLDFQKGIFGLKRQIVTGMLAIGLSPFLMNLCACFVVILINKSLKTYGGDLAIGAYGIVNRIIFLFIMIVMGFNQGMQPIAGYNFGARLFDRLIQVLKYTIFCGVTVTTIGFLAGQIFPRSLIYLFTSDETLTDIAVEGLRIVLIFFPVVGFQMVTSSFFQSIGMAKKAIFLSLTRQLLFLIPSLLIFPSIWGTIGVWMSMPVADAIATVVAACMLRWQLKHLKV